MLVLQSITPHMLAGSMRIQHVIGSYKIHVLMSIADLLRSMLHCAIATIP